MGGPEGGCLTSGQTVAGARSCVADVAEAATTTAVPLVASGVDMLTCQLLPMILD